MPSETLALTLLPFRNQRGKSFMIPFVLPLILAGIAVLKSCDGGESDASAPESNDQADSARRFNPSSLERPPAIRRPLINPLLAGVCSATAPECNLGNVPASVTNSEELHQWVLSRLTQPFMDEFRTLYTPSPDVQTCGHVGVFDHGPAALQFVTYGLMSADLSDVPDLRVTYSMGTTAESHTVTGIQLRDAVIARIQREFPETLSAAVSR